MSEEGKKISFGFSKFVKKTQIMPSTLNQVKPEKSCVELIDCFESKAIKLKNPVEYEDKLLVIPLKKQNETSFDNLKQEDSLILSDAALDPLYNDNKIKNETRVKGLLEGSLSLEPLTSKPLTLDEVAAKEILEDLKSKKTQVESRIFTVPLTNNPPSGENESTLKDYDNIPIGDFGTAMLRGMGWAPGKGIGKNEKLVTPSQPTLRPKGMGLGADTVLKASVQNKTSNEDLKMAKGSYIRVLAGQFKDSYGQVEGFDDETGRLIIKLSLKDTSVSLNEFMVQLVDKAEFIQNSKVINFTKYEQYKGDELKKKSLNTDKSLFDKSSNQTKPTDLEKPSTGKSKKCSESSLSSSENESIDRRSFNKRSSRSRSRSTSPVQKLKNQFLDSNKISYQEKQHSLIKSESVKKSKSSHKKSRSFSSSSSSDDSCSKYRKSSKSKNKIKTDKSSHSKKSSHRKKYRGSSSSSSSSSGDSSSLKKSKYRTEKKTSRSKNFKSRSRSRSPRGHTSSKKHKGKHRTS